MIAERLSEFLTSRGVDFETHEHPTAYTAQEVAAADHVPGRQVAKPVMLRKGDGIVMVVVPATEHVDLTKARALFGEETRLATENEFDDLFPDCDVGAEPPFGNLYGVPVYVDRSLGADRLVFSAGDHGHTIHMSRDDYLSLVEPTEVDLISGR